jgi:hypothetical protein
VVNNPGQSGPVRASPLFRLRYWNVHLSSDKRE